MKKTYLLTPGPTSIPEAVLSELAQPILYHRSSDFQELLLEVRGKLKYLFQTEQEVLLLAATGTGGMDAAVSNLFCKGDKVLVINAGKFGERWTKICQAYQLNPIELKSEPGEVPDPGQIENLISIHPDARAILFQASETSTGVQLPTEEICRLASRANMLSVCDAITACGVFNLPMDRWGIDVLITGSQKALMLPPGLAMIALSETAWTRQAQSTLPRFYFDLAKEKKNLLKNQTAWTPAISLIKGLRVSLSMIQTEGLAKLFKRHDLLARATRNAIQALGLERLAQKAPSTAVTAVKVPSQIKEGKLIPRTMKDKYGVTIAGGQDTLEGKIFRLSHLGYCDRFDIVTGVSALELTLNDLGYRVPYGTGVGAVLKTFAEEGDL